MTAARAGERPQLTEGEARTAYLWCAAEALAAARAVDAARHRGSAQLEHALGELAEALAREAEATEAHQRAQRHGPSWPGAGLTAGRAATEPHPAPQDHPRGAPSTRRAFTSG